MTQWRVVTNEFEGCGGNGFIECLCAGDFCACSNQGECRCVGCPDCRGYTIATCKNTFCVNHGLAVVGEFCPICEMETE